MGKRHVWRFGVMVCLFMAACSGDESGGEAGREADAGEVDPSGPDAGSGDDGGSDEDGGGTVGPIDLEVDEKCENLNPRLCLLPWPSNRWLEPNSDTVTGYAMALGDEAVPRPLTGEPFDVEPFRRLDGASPSSHIITVFDEPVEVRGMAWWNSIERSLESNHPTVLLDLETGERVAHWVENDARAESPEETLFYIRPAQRLKANRAYGVGLRGLVGESGAPIEADPVFAALRDGVETTSTQVEGRRPEFNRLFDALEAAGVSRDTLQSAWTFHTASDEAVRSRMLTVRDDALERMGEAGLGCTVSTVEDDFQGTGARRILGTFTVPWYLSAPLAPATFVYGDDGDPEFQGTEEIPFTAIVPASLLEGDAPGPLVTFGHGLFGNAEGTLSNVLAVGIAENLDGVLVATDWHGMSAKDLGFLATALTNVSSFYMIGDNLQQGMVNQMALTRSMLGSCRALPALQAGSGDSVINPEQSYFIGISQGSILGTTLLTLSPDIHRGLLLVGGSTFSFMIERSTHYSRFELLLSPFYGSRLETGTLMVLSQSVWDDAETAAWIGIANEGSADTEPKEFIYLVAENDAQVSNLSSDMAARTAGIPVMEGSSRTPWGIPVEAAPYAGSAYVAFGTWDQAPAGTNVSPESDDGGHNAVGFSEPATEMVKHFFDTGEVIVPCAPDCSAVDQE